jgi:hypothetical protein
MGRVCNTHGRDEDCKEGFIGKIRRIGATRKT